MQLHEETVFHNAIEIEDPEARVAYLDQACTGDDELKARVERLISVFPKGSVLEPVQETSAGFDNIDIASRPVIDRYKLLEEIGHGGMGSVYMAQQLKPIKRRVALKVINPGMDSREVIARFEAERQALAMMDHQNIARVLDAGTTKEHRPYFVMELVRGKPITEYCQQNRLGLDDRLHLFVDVCQAIQHAHQKGIIHRDIKPSNVMVSNHDGTPVVKVIDFGIAKALHQDLTDMTLFTQFSQMLGTPLYMSPEQAGLSNLDVDTRSDIYSLGVLLYELLTGTTPFDREMLAKAGIDGARRIICEREPMRPSTRFNTFEAAQDSTVKTRSPSQAKRLAFKLRSELDWIVMKALEKDRQQRYQTASDFALDVERHLNNDPIKAKPPTPYTRLAKWSRRHAALVWTLLLVSLTLATVFGVSAAMLADSRNKSNRQRELAVKEKQEALHNLYRANVQSAHYEWQDGRVDMALQHLKDVRPKFGDEDFRQWEWYYVRSLCQSDESLDGYLVDSPADCPLSLVYRVEGEGTYTFIDRDTGDVKLVVVEQNGLNGSTVKLDSNGRRLVFTSGVMYGDSNDLQVYDLASRRILWRKKMTPSVTAVDWGPNGDRIVTGHKKDRFDVWNAADGSLAANLHGVEGFGWAQDVTWSPDGMQIAAVGSGGGITWDAGTGEPRHRWAAHQKGRTLEDVTSVDWNPIGTRIATGGNGQLSFWDMTLKEPSISMSVAAHRGTIWDVAWSPDGESIATSSAVDGLVKIWNASNGHLQNEFRGHTGSVFSVRWIDEGKRLASKSRDSNRTELWQRSGEQRYVSLSPSGAVAWTPAGKLVTCADDGQSRKYNFFDPTTEKVTYSIVDTKLSDDVLCMAVDPMNQRLAIGHSNGTVRLWEIQTGKLLHSIDADSFQILCVNWSPDGNMLVSGSKTGFKVFNSKTREEIVNLQIEDGRANSHQSIAWSPDGRLLAGFKTRDVRVWRTDDWEEIHAMKTSDGGESKGQGLVWSPSGDRFATCTGEIVNVWNVSDGRNLVHIRAHFFHTTCIAWNPNGTRLASGGSDHLIKLWDPTTGEDLLTLSGHDNNVEYLAWSPDGRKLASSDGSTARIWDASSSYLSSPINR